MEVLIIIIILLLFLHFFTRSYINNYTILYKCGNIIMVNRMKKVNKCAKRRLLCLFTIFILLVSYVSYTSFVYWKQILNNNKQQKELEKKYVKLIENKEILEEDVVKLQDPEYVAKYAREKYLYSKDGELIIKIIDEN